MKNDKQHYWMTTGHAVFLEKESQRIFRTREYNSLLKSPVKEITMKDVIQIQQSFFMRATKEVDQTTVTTVDLVVANVMYLGFFSEKEFTAGTSVSTEAPVNAPTEEPRFQ